MQTTDTETLKAQLLHEPPFEDEMIVFSRIMFIDPGTVGTGMAFWQHLSTQPGLGSSGTTSPYTVALWKPNQRLEWRERADRIVEDILNVVKNLCPQIVVIEDTAVWGSSPRSVKAAIRGDLLKLIYIAARIEEGVRQVLLALGENPDIVFFLPNEWKQTLTKEAVAARVYRATGEIYADHVADAVGMGLAVQGIL